MKDVLEKYSTQIKIAAAAVIIVSPLSRIVGIDTRKLLNKGILKVVGAIDHWITEHSTEIAATAQTATMMSAAGMFTVLMKMDEVIKGLKYAGMELKANKFKKMAYAVGLPMTTFFALIAIRTAYTSFRKRKLRDAEEKGRQIQVDTAGYYSVSKDTEFLSNNCQFYDGDKLIMKISNQSGQIKIEGFTAQSLRIEAFLQAEHVHIKAQGEIVIAQELHTTKTCLIEAPAIRYLSTAVTHIEGCLQLSSPHVEIFGKMQIKSGSVCIEGDVNIYDHFTVIDSNIIVQTTFSTWHQSRVQLTGKIVIQAQTTIMRGDLRVENGLIDPKEHPSFLCSQSFELRPSFTATGNKLFIQAPRQEIEGRIKVNQLENRGKLLINYGKVEATQSFQLGFDAYVINYIFASLITPEARIESNFFNFGFIDITRFSFSGLVNLNAGLFYTTDSHINSVFSTSCGIILPKSSPNSWEWKHAFTALRALAAIDFPIYTNSFQFLLMAVNLVQNMKAIYQKDKRYLHEKIATVLDIKSIIQQGMQMFVSTTSHFKKNNDLKPEKNNRKKDLQSAPMKMVGALSGAYHQESIASWQAGLHLAQNTQFQDDLAHLGTGVQATLHTHSVQGGSLYLLGSTFANEASFQAKQTLVMGGSVRTASEFKLTAPHVLFVGKNTLSQGEAGITADNLEDDGYWQLYDNSKLSIESQRYRHGGKISAQASEFKLTTSQALLEGETTLSQARVNIKTQRLKNDGRWQLQDDSKLSVASQHYTQGGVISIQESELELTASEALLAGETTLFEAEAKINAEQLKDNEYWQLHDDSQLSVKSQNYRRKGKILAEESEFELTASEALLEGEATFSKSKAKIKSERLKDDERWQLRDDSQFSVESQHYTQGGKISAQKTEFKLLASQALLTGETTLTQAEAKVSSEHLEDKGDWQLHDDSKVSVESQHYVHSGRISSRAGNKASTAVSVKTITAQLSGVADVGRGEYQIAQCTDADSYALLQGRDQCAGYQFSSEFKIDVPQHWELAEPLQRLVSLDIGGKSIHLKTSHQHPEIDLTLRATDSILISEPATVRNFQAYTQGDYVVNRPVVAQQDLTVAADGHVHLLGANCIGKSVVVQGKQGINLVTQQTPTTHLDQAQLSDKACVQAQASRWQAAVVHLKDAQKHALNIFHSQGKHVKKNMKQWGKTAETYLDLAQKQLLPGDPHGKELQESLKACQAAAKANHTSEGFPQLEAAKKKVNELVAWAEQSQTATGYAMSIESGSVIQSTAQNTSLHSDGTIKISNYDISSADTTLIQGGEIKIRPGESFIQGRYEPVKQFHRPKISGGHGADNENVGLVVMATEHKLQATATDFTADSEMLLTGKAGTELDSSTESHTTCHKTYRHKSVAGRISGKKTKKHEADVTVHPCTVASPAATILSPEGPVNLKGAQIQTGSAAVQAQQSIHLSPVITQTVKKHKTSSLTSRTKAQERTESALPTRVHAENNIQVISETANIQAIGAELYARFGDIILQATKGVIVFQRLKLRVTHEIHDWNLNLDFPGSHALKTFLNKAGWRAALCAQWPTADSVQQLLHSENFGDYLQKSLRLGIHIFNDFAALAHSIATSRAEFNPRLALTFTHTRTRSSQEFLDAGQAYAGGEMRFTATAVSLENGVTVEAKAGICFDTPKLSVRAAELHSKFLQTTRSITVGGNLAGSVDVGYGQGYSTQNNTQYTSTHVKTGGSMQLGTMETLDIHGGVLEAQRFSGEVKHCHIHTPQDRARSKNHHWSTSTSGQVAVGYGDTEVRKSGQQSSLYAHENIDADLRIGRLSMRGGEIKSDKTVDLHAREITAETFRDTERTRGFAIGGNLTDFKRVSPKRAAQPGEPAIAVWDMKADYVDKHTKIKPVIHGAQGTHVEGTIVQGSIHTQTPKGRGKEKGVDIHLDVPIPLTNKNSLQQVVDDFDTAKEKIGLWLRPPQETVPVTALDSTDIMDALIIPEPEESAGSTEPVITILEKEPEPQQSQSSECEDVADITQEATSAEVVKAIGCDSSSEKKSEKQSSNILEEVIASTCYGFQQSFLGNVQQMVMNEDLADEIRSMPPGFFNSLIANLSTIIGDMPINIVTMKAINEALAAWRAAAATAAVTGATSASGVALGGCAVVIAAAACTPGLIRGSKNDAYIQYLAKHPDEEFSTWKFLQIWSNQMFKEAGHGGVEFAACLLSGQAAAKVIKSISPKLPAFLRKSPQVVAKTATQVAIAAGESVVLTTTDSVIRNDYSSLNENFQMNLFLLSALKGNAYVMMAIPNCIRNKRRFGQFRSPPLFYNNRFDDLWPTDQPIPFLGADQLPELRQKQFAYVILPNGELRFIAELLSSMNAHHADLSGRQPVVCGGNFAVFREVSKDNPRKKTIKAITIDNSSGHFRCFGQHLPRSTQHVFSKYFPDLVGPLEFQPGLFSMGRQGIISKVPLESDYFMLFPVDKISFSKIPSSSVSHPHKVVSQVVSEVFGNKLTSKDKFHLERRILFNLKNWEMGRIDLTPFLGYSEVPVEVTRIFVHKLKSLLKNKSKEILHGYRVESAPVIDPITSIAYELYQQPYSVAQPITSPVSFFSPIKREEKEQTSKMPEPVDGLQIPQTDKVSKMSVTMLSQPSDRLRITQTDERHNVKTQQPM